MASRIVYPVNFSHDSDFVAGVKTNKLAAYRIVENKNKALKNFKGESVPLPLRYDQVLNELRTKKVVRIPLADGTSATIKEEILSAK